LEQRQKAPRLHKIRHDSRRLQTFHQSPNAGIQARLRASKRALRYNSRFKATGQERLWVRGEKSAANLDALAHIALLRLALRHAPLLWGVLLISIY
jgi:hypothetical protein